MRILQTRSLEVVDDRDIAKVRHVVAELAREAQFGITGRTHLVTAASELARNMRVYGGGGQVEICRLADPPRHGLRIVFADQGPGIPDPEAALEDGFSSGDGLGLGLGGARRLVDEFDLQTTPGRGTRITLVSWRPGPPRF